MGSAEKDNKHPDSLFGPNIGVVSSGPAWTNINEKKVLSDELTQDIVRGWIEKSKEVRGLLIKVNWLDILRRRVSRQRRSRRL